MENNRRRRRRRRDNMPKAPKPKQTVESPSPIGGATTTPSPSTVHDVPDHVLEVIFLRLDSHVSLVRAASACKRWCRVVADAGFQSLFHPLPPAAPLILGHYYHALPSNAKSNGQLMAFEPSPSTPRSRRQSCLSLDFVPKLDNGIRDTLLLLSQSESVMDLAARSRSSLNDNPDLVVCRPATGMYKAISVPDRLKGRECLGWFLVDGGVGGGCGGGGIGLSSFKIIAVQLRDHMLVPGRGVPVACVYSRVTERRWDWHDVSCTWSGGDINIPNTAGSFYVAGRAGGRLYWAIRGARAALVLDEATMGVSLVALPVDIHPWHPRSRCFRVIGAGGGEDDGGGGAVASLRAVHLVANELRVYARLRVGGEWVLQNLLPLPVPHDDPQTTHGSPWNAMVAAAHEAYVLVTPRDSTRLFSVDLRTMAVECVRQRIVYIEGPAYPYELPWPPTLVDFEAAAGSSSNPQIQGHIETPYTKLKAKQNMGASLLYATVLLTFLLSMLLRSFCSIKDSGQ